MKRYAVLFVLLAILFSYSSCCTKKHCSDYGHSIRLEGFTRTDRDSLVIVEYDSQSPALDTIRYYADPSGDLQFTISVDKYYVFHCGNRTYRLDNFNVRKEVCNACFLGNDHYNFLASYNVNGIKKNRNSMNERIIINRID